MLAALQKRAGQRRDEGGGRLCFHYWFAGIRGPIGIGIQEGARGHRCSAELGCKREQGGASGVVAWRSGQSISGAQQALYAPKLLGWLEREPLLHLERPSRLDGRAQAANVRKVHGRGSAKSTVAGTRALA